MKIASQLLAITSALLFSVFDTNAYAITQSGCFTTDLLNGDGTHTKVLPFGCTFNSSATFGSTDGSIVINSFEQFASTNGIGGAYVSGTISGIGSFSGVGQETHQRDTMGSTLLAPPTPLNPTLDYPVTLNTETITGITQLPNFEMRLDPNLVSSGTYSAYDTGTLQNGKELYQVIDSFNLNFQASLDGGSTWISLDPPFSLYTFDPNTANPQIQEYLTSAVPEPNTYAMLLSGLGLVGFISYRRKNS